jgi:dynein heavy chain
LAAAAAAAAAAAPPIAQPPTLTAKRPSSPVPDAKKTPNKTGGDIVKQLPTEAKRFAAIDRAFMKAVAAAAEARFVVAACAGGAGAGASGGGAAPGGGAGGAAAGGASGGGGAVGDMLRSSLPGLLEQLEMCQKSLATYLEAKRAEFPR